MSERKYLSFGGGVNSVALGLWLIDHGIEAEWVYADHGADWPETREYVAMLRDKGYPITVLETGDLYGYCQRYRIIPSRQQRWCTRIYKVEPLRRYFERPCTVYLAIDAGESRRAKPSGEDDLEHEYPLVEEGIDRAGCVEIIKAHGLPLPGKSTCVMCPFQSPKDFVRLRTQHPDLYCKVRRLEDSFNERRRAIGKSPAHLRDKPLDAIAESDQLDLWGERAVTPCLCEL